MGQRGCSRAGLWALFTDAVIERKERARVGKGILASLVCIMHIKLCRSNLDQTFRAQASFTTEMNEDLSFRAVLQLILTSRQRAIILCQSHVRLLKLCHA